jgi:serine/threonine protein phosphatase PrpC
VATRRGGAVASQTALDEVARVLTAELLEDPGAGRRMAFVNAVLRANEHLYFASRDLPNEQRPATTFAGALLDSGLLHVVHAGDSRVWLFRRGVLRALTEDHTGLNELIARGYSEADARLHPMAKAVTRALGDRVTVLATIRSELLKADDLVLVSSDGLHGHVPASEITAILAAAHDLGAAVRHLVDRALAYGGPDNATAVLARVVASAEDEEPEPTPPTKRSPSFDPAHDSRHGRGER